MGGLERIDHEIFNGFEVVVKVRNVIPANQCYVRKVNGKYHVFSREQLTPEQVILAINNYELKQLEKDDKSTE